MSQTFFEKTMILFKSMEAHPENKLLYRNEIIELNMRLVNHVLKKYKPYTEDQYQAGCMGLILATDTFKEERGVPFSGYACFCIERELHKLHRYSSNLFESLASSKLVYLDKELTSESGDEYYLSDTIADIIAEEEFNQIIEDNDLEAIFNKLIIPTIEMIAKTSKGQNMKINIKDWQDLELRYLVELSQGSQKMRFNLTQMAEHLKVAIPNVRHRHIRVIEELKLKYKKDGYNNE